MAWCNKKKFLTKQQLWQKTSKNLMLSSQRCVKCKLVFMKCDRMYHVRLVACGYSHMPRVNFPLNYLPVSNDIMFIVLLMMIINFSFSAKVVDVEPAFLYGELEEKTYLECSSSLKDVRKYDCIILEKYIYSLVQVVRQDIKKP